MPLLTKQPEARLIFLADTLGREGKKKVPCLAFAGDPLDSLSELFFEYIKNERLSLRELGFWHTKPYLKRPIEVFDISRVNGNIDPVIELLRERYTPERYNCVRVAFQDRGSERDVTFAELSDGTMMCGYIPFGFLKKNIGLERRDMNVY